MPADLSQITWILTASERDAMPAMLRARCRIVVAAAPRPEDCDVILRGILDDMAREFEVLLAALPKPPPKAIAAMRQGVTGGRLQARPLAALVRRAMAVAADGERQISRH